MRLSDFAFPRDVVGDIDRLVSLIQRRDSDIRRVINGNERRMCDRVGGWTGSPYSSQVGLKRTETNDEAYVTIVDSPPAGTARIVHLVTEWNGDTGTLHPMIFLYDGTNRYRMSLTLLTVTTTGDLPRNTDGVYVVLPGMTLEVALIVPVVAVQPHITAHWTDMRLAGDETNLPFGANGVETDGTTEQVLVPAPAQGIKRIVRLVTLANRDNKATQMTLSLYDGTDRNRIYWEEIPQWQYRDQPATSGGYVVTPGVELHVALWAAAATFESHATAHWMDFREEGENED